MLAEIADDKAHLAALEAIDVAELSPSARFERDLELHNVRRAIFDPDVLRIWERRSFALDAIGDGLFLLFARDHAPLAERLAAITGPARGRARLPRARRRPARPSRRSGAGSRSSSRRPASCPPSSTSSWRPGRRLSRRPSSAAWSAPPTGAKVAIELYGTWLEGTLAIGTDDVADRPGAARRAGRPSGLRRPRRGRDPRARLAEAGRGEGRARSRRRARSTPTRARRRSSAGSRRTARPTSTAPSRAIERRCSGRASTSSSTTW